VGTHYVGSQKEIRALNAYIKLLRSTQSLGERIARHQAVPDLNGSQFGALEALYHLGPLPQKTIGKKLLISKSNVVAVIDALEERGFVLRQRDPEDRRIINVSITQDGRKYIERVFPIHVGTIVEELSCLTAREQDELARLCRKLGRNEQA
jgi:MarR family transcriptional regulator, 2-MHQ and catechol-resistance regulon repressor